MNEKQELELLRKFYKRIAFMTLNHDEIADCACVGADKLGKELVKINKEWYTNEFLKGERK